MWDLQMEDLDGGEKRVVMDSLDLFLFVEVDSDMMEGEEECGSQTRA